MWAYDSDYKLIINENIFNWSTDVRPFGTINYGYLKPFNYVIYPET